jgi:hypothetical protein
LTSLKRFFKYTEGAITTAQKTGSNQSPLAYIVSGHPKQGEGPKISRSAQ